MKYFLLISVLFITNITYAQLPGVIGKDKAIMDAYCDTLMAKLHLTKKVKETQHVFILRDKDKHNIIRVNYEVDKNNLVSQVAIIGDTPLIEQMYHTIYQGKRVFFEYIHARPQHHMMTTGKMAYIIFNAN